MRVVTAALAAGHRFVAATSQRVVVVAQNYAQVQEIRRHVP